MKTVQQFDRPDQAKAYSAFRPAPPAVLLDSVLEYLEEKVPRPFELAVDVGCGTGQSTLALAPYFRSVLGCDISESQIEEAMKSRKVENIKYSVSPAESLSVPDHSVHLLTASTCFHWLDTKAFFKEAKRVLAPGGVLAVYSSCAIYPMTENEDKNYILRYLTDKLLYEDLKGYRSHKVQTAFEQYRSIEFPFDEVIRLDKIGHVYLSDIADAVGYIKSMSTYQNFKESHPQKADQLLQHYHNSIIGVLNNDHHSEEDQVAYRRDYCLILCRDQNGNV